MEILKLKKNNILIIAAHPDDEILGCGGLIAKYRNNSIINTVFMSDGVTSRTDANKKKIFKRKNSSKKLFKKFNLNEPVFLDFPDNQMDKVPFLNIVIKIEKYMKKFRPNTIITHYENCLNIDHKITFNAVVTACRPLKGNSVKNQIQSIKNYCSVNDLELVKIYEDKGISGMSNKRIGLNDMFDNIKNSDIEGLIVYSLSRLGRKLKDVIDFIDVLSKNDIRFISLKENFNNNDIVGKLMFNILGSINEFEVNLLSQRIKDVKQYKKSKNEVYCGNILFGKKRIGKKLVDDNNELEILKTINDLRNQNYSYNKISKHLNTNNILSKEKCQWYGSSVRSVYLNGVLN